MSAAGLLYLSGTGLGRSRHAADKAAPGERLTPKQRAILMARTSRRGRAASPTVANSSCLTTRSCAPAGGASAAQMKRLIDRLRLLAPAVAFRTNVEEGVMEVYESSALNLPAGPVAAWGAPNDERSRTDRAPRTPEGGPRGKVVFAVHRLAGQPSGVSP